MRIEERLQRSDDSDIVIMGDLIHQGLNSEFGRLLLAMINNFKSMEIQKSIASKESSEKVLGRLEAYESILGDLKGMIVEKERIQRPLEALEPETELAAEQTTVLRGGEV